MKKTTKRKVVNFNKADKSKKGGSCIKKMHISKEGELITQWPKGFFSNDIDEMFDL